MLRISACCAALILLLAAPGPPRSRPAGSSRSRVHPAVSAVADVTALQAVRLAAQVKLVQAAQRRIRKAERHRERRAADRRAQAREAAAARAVVPAAAPQAPSEPSGSPQQIAAGMLGGYGWDAAQMGCLIPLWNDESGWNVHATNPGSGAYGIPQSLPGDKMAAAGPDWQTDAATQIRWGLGYLKSTYGSPCAGWSHEEAEGWY